MKKTALLFAAALALSQVPASAPAQEPIAPELTPLGAEKSGNDDGTIPEWTGGLTEPPAGAGAGGHPADPYPEDEPLFEIHAGNLTEHAAFLAPGQIALLKAYPDHRFRVFETRRSCTQPTAVSLAALKNAATAMLVDEGAGVIGARLGVPFPVPGSGVEVVWNHLLRYRGYKIERSFATITPTVTGEMVPLIIRDRALFRYADPAFNSEGIDATSLLFSQETLAPAPLAGIVTLVHDTLDKTRTPRRAWRYNPAIKRVVRAPVLGYDAPQSNSDQLSTVDQYDMFNGAPDRYDWALVGKRELYVPYNAYRLANPDLTYEELIETGHLNPGHLRYEKHRVWVVEGVLKRGARHLYPRRVFYIDEDSWTILHADIYDARGHIWRVQEAHILNYYTVPVCMIAAETVHDLEARRIYVSGLKNDQPPVNWFADHLSERDFTPAALLRQNGAQNGENPPNR